MSTPDQRDEKISSLSQQLHAAQVRILKLESSNTALARMAANLTERLAMHEAGQDGKVSKRKRGL